MISNPYFTEALAKARRLDLVAEARERDRLVLAGAAFPPEAEQTFISRRLGEMATATRRRRTLSAVRDLVGSAPSRHRRWAAMSTTIVGGSGGCG